MGNNKDRRHRVYPLVLVEVLVWYKSTVPDPEKAALIMQLHASGFDQVISADRAKYFRIQIKDSTLRKAGAQGRGAGRALLANQIIENFEVISVAPITS